MKGQNYSILIIDDNAETLSSLEEILARAGFITSVSRSGSQSVELLKNERFDLILLDLMLTEISGFELLKQIKAQPFSARTPVIMISSMHNADAMLKSIELGADDYIVKPFHERLITARIKTSIEKYLNTENETTAPDTNIHILVVEDDQMNRDLLERRLTYQNFSVTTAINGQEALDKLKTQPFDVILLDIMMPVMDGYDTLRNIKQNPELANIPVIVLSAIGESESIRKCLELGAFDYLAKPFNNSLLMSRLAAAAPSKNTINP